MRALRRPHAEHHELLAMAQHAQRHHPLRRKIARS
jgi:hypothetical protein